MDPGNDEQLTERERADLARLADGTLPARRRAELEARVAASPHLRAGLEAQRRAVALVRGAGGEAPAGLRARLQDARRAAAPRARRWRIGLGAGLAAAATGTALALVLTLPGDVPGGPTVVQAAQVASRPPQGPAPRHLSADPSRLNVAVDGIAFPNWDYRLHWPAVGRRTDLIHGRRVTTVYYRRGPRVVGYAIIAGKRVPPPVATSPVIQGHTVYRHFRAGNRTVVTWVRDGHTCVLTGADTPVDVMVRLAAWDGAGA
jgi:hypothetical protein